MDWINENLQILATLGSALAVYIFLRTGAKKDITQIKEDIKEIKISLKSMDNRLYRLEGYIEGRDVNLKVKGE